MTQQQEQEEYERREDARIAAKPTGLPRPLGLHMAEDDEGRTTKRPIPWSQEDAPGEQYPAWGQIDEPAAHKGTRESLCLVCGEHVEEGYVVLAVGWQSKPLKRRRMIYSNELSMIGIADNGPMHDKCMLLTRCHCAAIRDGLKNKTYKQVKYRKKKRKSA